MQWTAAFVAVALLGCGESVGTWDRGVGDTPPNSWDAGSGAEGGAGPGDTYSIDPAALVGCRAADEAGCSECCVSGSEPCVHWGGDGVSFEGHYAWEEQKEGSCPGTCAPCAPCSRYAEEGGRRALNALASRTECDCEHLGPPIDPCFDRDGCECLCIEVLTFRNACPPPP